VVLKVDGQEFSTPMVIQQDPRVNVGQADFVEQDELLKKLEQDVTDIHVAVTRMRNLSKQISQLSALIENDPSKAAVVKLGKDIIEKLKALEDKLIQPKSQSYDDVINFVNKLSANIIFVHGEVNSNVPYVTAGQKARYEELHAEWLGLKQDMDQLMKKDVAGFNALCKQLAVEHVLLPE
jgi:DNA repair exonuclease SbcCD ATPase subunit